MLLITVLAYTIVLNKRQAKHKRARRLLAALRERARSLRHRTYVKYKLVYAILVRNLHKMY